MFKFPSPSCTPAPCSPPLYSAHFQSVFRLGLKWGDKLFLAFTQLLFSRNLDTIEFIFTLWQLPRGSVQVNIYPFYASPPPPPLYLFVHFLSFSTEWAFAFHFLLTQVVMKMKQTIWIEISSPTLPHRRPSACVRPSSTTSSAPWSPILPLTTTLMPRT